MHAGELVLLATCMQAAPSRTSPAMCTCSPGCLRAYLETCSFGCLHVMHAGGLEASVHTGLSWHVCWRMRRGCYHAHSCGIHLRCVHVHWRTHHTFVDFLSSCTKHTLGSYIAYVVQTVCQIHLHCNDTQHFLGCEPGMALSLRSCSHSAVSASFKFSRRITCVHMYVLMLWC